jgi:predicted glutamine amidotransferase
MCVAILKTPAGVLSDAVLRACFENNQDGAGFAFVDADGKLIVNKGYFQFQQFLDAYRPVEEKVHELGPMLVHFRISTGGTKTEDNCHPFLFKHGALIHNGHFFSAIDNRSDTHLLVDKIGDNLSLDSVRLHKKAIEDAFTAHNKVVILYPNRQYEIINEDKGTWDNGVWFSNTYWKYRMNGGGSGTTVVRDFRVVGGGSAADAGCRARDFHVD